MPDRGFNVERLPKAAVRYIEKLERDLAHERAKLAAGAQDSNTFADPYAGTPRPLGRDTRVAFRPETWSGNDGMAQSFHARMVDATTLEVRAPWHLVILPQSSSAVWLRTE